MKNNVYKSIIISLIIITITILLPANHAETQEQSFSYTRIYSDEKGVTHFADESTDWIEYGWMEMYQTEYMESKTIIFFRCPSDWKMDWHPAPAKQFNIVLKGTMEIEVGNDI